MRKLLKALLLLVALYLLIVAGLFVAMRQPPATFGQIMARMPGPAFMMLPFRPIWMLARKGDLEPGDPAPDFTLPLLDRSARVTLSSFRGQRPVVLVFGSYT